MSTPLPRPARPHRSADRRIVYGPAAPAAPPFQVVHAVAVLRGIDLTSPRALDPREADALAVLYRAYGGVMRAAARRVLADDAAAEDVLHDVFVRLPWVMAQYRDGGLGGWLKQLAVRTALMRRRAEWRRREEALGGDDMAASLACVGTMDTQRGAPIDRLADACSARALHLALARLPEQSRRAVVLRVVLGYSHREVAARLGITPTASEVRVCRALKQLRAALERTRHENESFSMERAS